jgi:pilus assembly protein Flp/PilA
MEQLSNNDNQNKGQGLIEYALILVFLALVVVVVLRSFGPSLGLVFSKIGSQLVSF